MKIALISDASTYECLQRIATVVPITDVNYKWRLWYRRPDILFVESAWQWIGGRWKYKIASYPEHPHRNNKSLAKVVAYAKKLKIPTVFWNKEDGVHFERFIGSAKLFDYVFTVDEGSVPRYRQSLDSHIPVNTMMFPVEPTIHRFEGFNFKYNTANFVGSYSNHIHARRRNWQNMLFNACSISGLGVVVFDRNSDRNSKNYRYPSIPGLYVRPSLAHADTAAVYKQFLVSLNVNTIENSTTMFSRRLVEILACGGIAVTTPSIAVDKNFKDYCYIVHNVDESIELFSRLKGGASDSDLERARAGAQYVASNHTWTHRLKMIYEIIGI